MLARLRLKRPNHATVVAYIALFVALGGTTYAAATIGSKDIKRNAVLSRHIARGAVHRSDLARNAVNGAKVQDHSLTRADIQASAFGLLTPKVSELADGASATLYAAHGLSLVGDCSPGIAGRTATLFVRAAHGTAATVIGHVGNSTNELHAAPINGDAPGGGNQVSIAWTDGSDSATQGDFNGGVTAGRNKLGTLSGGFYLRKTADGCEIAAYGVAN